MNQLELQTQYIHNAGLVLLNPFLATVFTKVEYLSGGNFINHEEQIRAAQLLQYLIDGETVHTDTNLALNKLLCGLSNSETIPDSYLITEQEKEITNSCLHAILQQWDKLKNTSIDGFRESFLKRDAVLTKTKDGYHLKIEQRGYDLLLQTLPWSFGMIKFNWMNEIVYVEWI